MSSNTLGETKTFVNDNSLLRLLVIKKGTPEDLIEFDRNVEAGGNIPATLIIKWSIQKETEKC